MPPGTEVAVIPSVRDAVESAVAVVEKAEPAPAPSQAPVPIERQEREPEQDRVPLEEGEAPKAPVGEPKKDTAAAKPGAELDAPPKSWKVNARSKWADIPAEARAEIHRRDRDVVKALSDGAAAKSFQNQVAEIVRPFEARLRTLDMAPLKMISELLKADYLLSTAGPVQQAQYMAKLIKDYEVDIRALDDALAGTVSPDRDPTQATIDRLLQERLGPLNQFVAAQQAEENRRQAAMQADANSAIEAMAENDKDYPHFDLVRQDMADLIEISAKRGLYIEPQIAYTRAVAMNPELAAQTNAQRSGTQQREQASAANARAHKALAASQSVTGTPSGIPGNSGSTGSLRETIEAAFTQATGR